MCFDVSINMSASVPSSHRKSFPSPLLRLLGQFKFWRALLATAERINRAASLSKYIPSRMLTSPRETLE